MLFDDRVCHRFSSGSKQTGFGISISTNDRILNKFRFLVSDRGIQSGPEMCGL